MTDVAADVSVDEPSPQRPPPDPSAAAAAVFSGVSEMAGRCRALDWAATPLGPVDTWPAALQVAAQMVVAAGLPNIVLWGPELIQLYNDSYARLIRAKHPHALGRGNRAVWPEVWHLNGPIYDRVFAGETVTVEDAYYPLLRQGAEGAWAEEDAYLTISFSPIRDDTGAVAGVLANMLETTREVARRHAEAEQDRLAAALAAERARLADVVRVAPAFMVVLRGPEHVLEVVNDAYQQLIGHRDVVGRPLFEAVPEARGQGFEALLDGVLATGEPFVGRGLPVRLERIRGAPPEERLIDLAYVPLAEADGSRSGIVVLGTDVTEQVQARRQVEALLDAERATRAEAEAARAEAEAARAIAEQARARATEANRGKGEFLAVMSHELRTPLNAIGGYAELLELGIRGPVTAQQREDLGRIQRAQRHLLGLINGVLNYAKIDAGAVAYAVEAVPLDEVLATCEALVAPQVRAKRLTLTHDAPDRSLVVRADREKVQQAVLNLLSNAVKFTEPGGHLTLASAAADGVVRVTVRDTGIGIAADQLGRVFEPFVQVDARLTRTQEGTGLGLAISRDLARGMGGDLTAESVPAAGSTFTLTLPAAESTAE